MCIRDRPTSSQIVNDDYSDTPMVSFQNPPPSQLRISTLRKFDKIFMKKCRGKKNTFTCSSKSTYSISVGVDEKLDEEDADSEVDDEEEEDADEEELLSKVDATPDFEDIRAIEEHLQIGQNESHNINFMP